MISTARTRSSKLVLTGALLLAVGVLPACSSDEADPGDPQQSGVTGAASDGDVCPSELPRPEASDDGFGTQDPAGSAPSLGAPDEATVCLYDPTESDDADGAETSYTWALSGEPIPVGERDLKALTQQLGELVPAQADKKCPSKPDTRWMLVTTAGDDVTGVVVDDFGCRSVRLTDAPSDTAPGEATREDTVAGVLTGPTSLLNQIKLVWVNG